MHARHKRTSEEAAAEAVTRAAAEWKPKYQVLHMISSGSFNLITLDEVEPLKPPIRRRRTETTRQFIERAMRENRGYTVPARWLADLDAIPATSYPSVLILSHFG
jgi:hypothetical protein